MNRKVARDFRPVAGRSSGEPETWRPLLCPLAAGAASHGAMPSTLLLSPRLHDIGALWHPSLAPCFPRMISEERARKATKHSFGEWAFPSGTWERGNRALRLPKRDGKLEGTADLIGDVRVERRLPLFLDDDSADEFGAASVRVELGELVILRDIDRRDAGADFGKFKHLGRGAYGGETIRCGSGVKFSRSVSRQVLAACLRRDLG